MGLTCPLFFVNWICAINNINTDGVACALCGQACVRASAGAYPAWQPITSEFEFALIECEFFGSVLSHHALNQFPSSARASILLLHRPRASLEHCGLIRPVSVASLTFSIFFYRNKLTDKVLWIFQSILNQIQPKFNGLVLGLWLTYPTFRENQCATFWDILAHGHRKQGARPPPLIRRK